jgi:hypothetical protein
MTVKRTGWGNYTVVLMRLANLDHSYTMTKVSLKTIFDEDGDDKDDDMSRGPQLNTHRAT